MDKKKLLILLLSFLSIILFAQPQQVISSAGNMFEHSSGSISFTMGECITITCCSETNILTQGFQQSRLVIIDIGPPREQQIEISAFPNPANSYVILKTENYQGLTYTLYDLTGRIIEQNGLYRTETTIDFSSLVPSTYLLKVNNQEELRIFKITKH